MTSSKLVNVNVSVRAEQSSRFQQLRESRQQALAKDGKRK